ncbi:hypothetical protein KTO58_26550 [Chitinophaga pendula]|uniref:hypothetical protein n=1 Tax=Chitinophaga TaxID=79328 RepID=UPI000BAEB112|nr:MULTISPECIES: hypothetical protein [Chitinophaga]ASZ09877.1 hypothetical protein CK934_02220 [Chitinophaga sp. MD30]UCJ07182.1 hypothetical protein KTO58_26550 [Chitinophaga pendula]
MSHKYIVVPKNQEAMDALNYDNATPEQLIEIVLTDQEFQILSDKDFFQSINTIATVNIDIYEDDSIKDREELERVLKSDIFKIEYIDKIKQIRILFEEALERATGVFFYF